MARWREFARVWGGLKRPQTLQDFGELGSKGGNSRIADLEFGFGPRVPAVLQTEAAECGLACLAMVACYHGYKVELSDLRRDYPISLKGMTLTHLVAVARQLGLSARALRIEIEDLSQLKLPCVLHWDLDHFVVLKAVARERITIIDPAIGVRTISRADASACFTGVSLELWPGPEFRSFANRPESQLSVRKLLGKTVGLVPLFLQVMALALGIELLALITPLMTQWIIDYVIVSHDHDLLVTCGLGFGLVILIQESLVAMRAWVLIYLGTTMSVQWNSNVFAHLVRLPIEYFQRRHLGDLVSRFQSIAQIQNTLTESFVVAVLDGIMSGATLILMIAYSYKLTFVVVLASLLYLALRILTFAPLRGTVQEKIVLAARQETHFLETLRGIKAVKLFQREDLRRLNWLTLLVQQTNAGLKGQRAMLIFRTANGLLFGAQRIIVLWWGAEMIMQGDFTIGVLMAFMAYKEQFDSRIISLTDKYFEFRMLRLHTARLGDIVMTPPEPEPRRVSITQIPDIDPNIVVASVKYRYSIHEPYVLRDVSLAVNGGETVAIVGGSGCGKTTLVNILLGILRPSEGAVRVGGVDIQHLGPQALRKVIGSVSQDDTLFAGSIAQNIAFFDEHQDQKKIEACAKLAAIHEDIVRMPMGYRTLVGDMGTSLSGGQRQRVLIARSLYYEPKILILDEATSNLDLECEARVMAALKTLGITQVIVSHRAETVAVADRVVSLC